MELKIAKQVRGVRFLLGAEVLSRRVTINRLIQLAEAA